MSTMPTRKTTEPETTANKPSRAKKRKPPTHEQIEQRAYEISQSSGNGDPVEHWLEAERELVEAAAPKPRRRKTAEQ
jgi:DUF2934 family protein